MNPILLLEDRARTFAAQGFDPIAQARSLLGPRERLRALATVLPLDPNLAQELAGHLFNHGQGPWAILAHVAQRAPWLGRLWGIVAVRHSARRWTQLLLHLGWFEAAQAYVQRQPRRADGVRHELDRLLATGEFRGRFAVNPWSPDPWPDRPALAHARLSTALDQADPVRACAWAADAVYALPWAQQARLRPALAELLARTGDVREAGLVARSLRGSGQRKALARVANPSTGPLLVQPLSDPAHEAVQRFVADPRAAEASTWLSRISRDPAALRVLMSRTVDPIGLWTASVNHHAVQLAMLAYCVPRPRFPLPDVAALQAMRRARDGHPPDDAQAKHRVWFDRAAATRGDPGRRHARVRAAASALRRGVTCEAEPASLRRARWEVLVRTGGARSVRALQARVDADDRSSVDAWRALARLAPSQALRSLLRSDPERVLRCAPDILPALEAAGAVHAGTTLSWNRFCAAVDPPSQHEAVQTLVNHQEGAFPSPAVLQWCTEALADTSATLPAWVAGPQALAEALQLDPHALVRLLRARPGMRQWLELEHPCRLGRWSPQAWDLALASAASVARLDVEILQHAAAILGCSKTIAQLILGALPHASPYRLPDGHTLRWLDKRRDLLTWQRFADAAGWCCYSTRDSSWYPDHRVYIAMLWADPLSFAWHVEDPYTGKPVGFVFGCLGERGGPHRPVPVAFLNGVYLRRRRDALRAAVAEGLVDGFLRPLGVRAVAMASVHGGTGPELPGWERASFRVRRLRALQREGVPVVDVYDDIGFDTNVWCHSPKRLRWRELATA